MQKCRRPERLESPRVREATQKFKDDEEELLRVRNEAARTRVHEVERSVSVRIGGFSALMAVLFLLVIRESKKLRIAEQNALNAQLRLEGLGIEEIADLVGHARHGPTFVATQARGRQWR